MNKVLFKYLLAGYFKRILITVLIVFCFGLIFNLFEEIEFFKNLNVPVFVPLMLTSLYIPSMIIRLLPFIIFVSSLWHFLQLRNTKELLTMKVFGYSNFKIFFILATSSFLIGWLVLFVFNPVTSKMIKYYEQTKSQYSRDIDHLVSINKNGLWIKENIKNGYRIISADKTRNEILENITIFNLDKNYNLVGKIHSDSADASKKEWVLSNVKINEFRGGIVKQTLIDKKIIVSQYDYQKISSLFRNFDTMSFLDVVLDYKDLQSKGYSKRYLDQNLNSFLSIPFFLFIMTALASILTMNTLKKSNNFTYIIVGLIVCVAIYFFKDLSLALGQTNRISLSLAAWVPVFAVGLFSSIGILQINEK